MVQTDYDALWICSCGTYNTGDRTQCWICSERREGPTRFARLEKAIPGVEGEGSDDKEGRLPPL